MRMTVDVNFSSFCKELMVNVQDIFEGQRLTQEVMSVRNYDGNVFNKPCFDF